MIRPGVLSAADAAELDRLMARVRSLESISFTPPLVATSAPGGVRSVMLAGDIGTARLIAVRCTATPSTVDTYTTGTVQKWDFGTEAWTADTETVVFKPFVVGQRPKNNTVWLCQSLGGVNGDTPPKRKLLGVVPPMILRQVQVLCTDGTPQYANVWVPDVA